VSSSVARYLMCYLMCINDSFKRASSRMRRTDPLDVIHTKKLGKPYPYGNDSKKAAVHRLRCSFNLGNSLVCGEMI